MSKTQPTQHEASEEGEEPPDEPPDDALNQDILERPVDEAAGIGVGDDEADVERGGGEAHRASSVGAGEVRMQGASASEGEDGEGSSNGASLPASSDMAEHRGDKGLQLAEDDFDVELEDSELASSSAAAAAAAGISKGPKERPALDLVSVAAAADAGHSNGDQGHGFAGGEAAEQKSGDGNVVTAIDRATMRKELSFKFLNSGISLGCDEDNNLGSIDIFSRMLSSKSLSSPKHAQGSPRTSPKNADRTGSSSLRGGSTPRNAGRRDSSSSNSILEFVTEEGGERASSCLGQKEAATASETKTTTTTTTTTATATAIGTVDSQGIVQRGQPQDAPFVERSSSNGGVLPPLSDCTSSNALSDMALEPGGMASNGAEKMVYSPDLHSVLPPTEISDDLKKMSIGFLTSISLSQGSQGSMMMSDSSPTRTRTASSDPPSSKGTSLPAVTEEIQGSASPWSAAVPAAASAQTTVPPPKAVRIPVSPLVLTPGAPPLEKAASVTTRTATDLLQTSPVPDILNLPPPKTTVFHAHQSSQLESSNGGSSKAEASNGGSSKGSDQQGIGRTRSNESHESTDLVTPLLSIVKVAQMKALEVPIDTLVPPDITFPAREDSLDFIRNISLGPSDADSSDMIEIASFSRSKSGHGDQTLSPIAIEPSTWIGGQNKPYSPQPSPQREAIRSGVGSASPQTDTPEVRMQLLRNQSNRTMLSIKGSREFERQLSSRIYAESFKTRIQGCSLLPNPRRKTEQKQVGHRKGRRISSSGVGGHDDAGEETILSNAAGSIESSGTEHVLTPRRSGLEDGGVLDEQECGALRKIGPRHKNLHEGLLMDSKMFLCTVKGATESGERQYGSPMWISSVRMYRSNVDDRDSDDGEVVHSLDTRRGLIHGSYSELLQRKGESDSDDSEEPEYNPLFLDDPEMRSSKHRTVIKQAGYIVSCIPFVKPNDMKGELNELFLAKHGDWLESRDMTLSKIRALKSKIIDIVTQLDLELSTAAIAHVYLEKLILNNLARKHSRKITAAVCLLLALKFNESPRDTRVSSMVETVEKQNRAAQQLFVVNSDAGKPVPVDVVKLHRLQEPLCKATWGQGHHYLLLTFNSLEVSARYKGKLTGQCLSGYLPEGHKYAATSLVADYIPVPVAHTTRKNERTGKGEKGGYGCYSCSVTEFLLCAEKVMGVDKRSVLDEEFATYVDLKMCLHVGPEEFLPHFQRILHSLEVTSGAYLGQDNITMCEAEGIIQQQSFENSEEEDI